MPFSAKFKPLLVREPLAYFLVSFQNGTIGHLLIETTIDSDTMRHVLIYKRALLRRIQTLGSVSTTIIPNLLDTALHPTYFFSNPILSKKRQSCAKTRCDANQHHRKRREDYLAWCEKQLHLRPR